MISGSDGSWLPLGLEKDQLAAYTALSDGVPPWLQASLWKWIQREFTTRGSGYAFFNADFARTCERILRVNLRYGGTSLNDGMQVLRQTFGGEPMATWRLVDFLLPFCEPYGYDDDPVIDLDAQLLQAGSVWKVGRRHGVVGLERRVPEGVAVAAESAFVRGDAGRLLAQAWEAIYGFSPDPSNGYRLAIKAVEDAVFAVVCPNDSSATLGKALGNLEKGTWRLPHDREDPRATSHDVLVSMLRLIWVGQHDRHGADSVVSQDEAESTLNIAVALVGLFAGGIVRK